MGGRLAGTYEMLTKSSTANRTVAARDAQSAPFIQGWDAAAGGRGGASAGALEPQR